MDPGAEADLLAGVEDEGLQAVKERCRRTRATAARHDPLAAARRIHAERHFTHWTDGEGAFCFSGRDSAERGAALLARLVPTANRLRDARRSAATPAPSAPTRRAHPGPAAGESQPEPDVALRADALFAIVTGTSPARVGPSETATSGTSGAGSSGPDASGAPSFGAVPSGLQSADDLGERTPPTTVIVRVDRDALLRGRAAPGELCELDGQGPIPVPLARALAVDSFLSVVFTEAGDIRAVSHLGRTINATLRTALTFRDRCCVVPGCGMPYGLEIDHVTPLALGGPTTLDNLALLCTHHHRLKTYDGWVLERHGPSDEDPQWSFAPQPAFGQEPDLGLDRPPEGAPPDDRTLFDRSPEVVPRS